MYFSHAAAALPDTGASYLSSPRNARSKSPFERPRKYSSGTNFGDLSGPGDEQRRQSGSRTARRRRVPASSWPVWSPKIALNPGAGHIRSSGRHRCPYRTCGPTWHLRGIRRLLFGQVLDEALNLTLNRPSKGSRSGLALRGYQRLRCAWTVHLLSRASSRWRFRERSHRLAILARFSCLPWAVGAPFHACEWRTGLFPVRSLSSPR